MRSRFVRTFAILLAALGAALALVVGVALAQDYESRSGFVRFIEDSLSTPNRKISLIGFEGVFSWNPRIATITVADRDGVWLKLDGVEVAWNRAALLRKVLDIDVLRASEVTLLRRPAPSDTPSGSVAAPPLQVVVDSIALPKVTLEQAVAGAKAELSASGSAELTREAFALKVQVDRQDRPGSLAADLRFEPSENVLTADLKLEEPSDGLMTELLDLRGAPAISATLNGSGPLDKWQANLDVQADQTRIVSGAMSIMRSGSAYQVVAKLAAALETLVPVDYAPLVAGISQVDLDLSRADNGEIALNSATMKSDGLDFSAHGVLSADMVPQRAEVALKLGQAGRTEFPFLGDVSVTSVNMTGKLESGDAAPWRVQIEADGVEGDFGRVEGIALDATGLAQDLARPSARSVNFNVTGSAEGLVLADADLRAAVGASVKLIGAGAWVAGEPVAINNLQITMPGASATFAGTATRDSADGTFVASISDLSRLGAIAKRPLAGGVDVQARGSITAAGMFDMTLDGTAKNLTLGVATLDSLIDATTRIEGGIARRSDGFAFNALKLSNDRLSAEVTGSLADPAMDLSVSTSIADLALITPRASGAASVSAKLSGSREAPKVEATAAGENVVLMGRPLSNATARFSGIVAGPDTSGEGELAGTLGETNVSGSAKLLAGENGARTLENLVISAGESRAAGNVVLGADGLLSGELKLVSPDLSKVAPLFLVKGSGMVRADVTLSGESGAQSAAFSGTATDIVYENVTLESADISGNVRDLFRTPEIEGRFAVRNLTAGGLQIIAATGLAARRGNATGLNVDARLSDGRATLVGGLAPRDGGLALALESFAYSRPGIELALASPTTIAVKDGIARFERTTFRTGGGTVMLSGRAGSTLDVSATLNSVPAALANSFVPNLAAEGTISGTVVAKGTAAAPNASFDLTLAGTSIAASRNAGLGALGVAAKGGLANKVVTLSSRISGADGLAIDVNGTVGATAGGPLKLRVTGAAPLSLGNRQLASRGAALQGTINLDIAVGGTASAPKFSGRATSQGGGFVDPDSGIVLRNVVLAATLSGDRVIVEQLNAQSGEGTVAGMGSIGLDPNAGFPVDLAVQVRKARYVDGTLVAARFDADLKLSGTMSAGPVLEGAVFLDRTEVSVPERLPRDSLAVDVRHVDPPKPVEETLAAVRERDARGTRGGGPAGIRLDVAVNAPQRIFVRGRGLDAELGGDLRLVGPMSSLAASGAFAMVRGRLDILTQRITFDRGIVTFAGDLDPILEFSGSTRSRDTTITVTVAGRASDPEVTFTSVPELPQDEILARLIFNKGIGELSPVQVARLAAAVSTLAGGSGGILAQLRASTGLDDLDIVTDEKGQTAVAAGRYISDNVYVGVQQGATTESSRVTIDLDVTKDVKARAGMTGEGGSSLGIFFEREY
jgi:translocation and assembly module TamB